MYNIVLLLRMDTCMYIYICMYVDSDLKLVLRSISGHYLQQIMYTDHELLISSIPSCACKDEKNAAFKAKSVQIHTVFFFSRRQTSSLNDQQELIALVFFLYIFSVCLLFGV